jgi:hypothetical protein
VIGVAYAVLSRFGGNSFAVPVRRALPLVARPAPAAGGTASRGGSGS